MSKTRRRNYHSSMMKSEMCKVWTNNRNEAVMLMRRGYKLFAVD